MRQEDTQGHIQAAVSDGWVAGGSFLGSILSGMLLGLLADRWLGTDPLLVVIGIVLGSVSGFYRMWALATKGDDERTN